MTSGTGRNRDLIPKNTGFIEKCGVFLLHSHGAAAATDIAGESQQILHRDQLHILVPSGFCCFFQIQFAADRDAEYIDAGSFTSGYQCFEHLLRRKTESFGGMIAV